MFLNLIGSILFFTIGLYSLFKFLLIPNEQDYFNIYFLLSDISTDLYGSTLLFYILIDALVDLFLFVLLKFWNSFLTIELKTISFWLEKWSWKFNLLSLLESVF